MSGLVTLGESMALFRPATAAQGELADDYRLSFGGAETNVAIGVARLGGRAIWMGRLGDDAPGRRMLRELRAEAVDVRARIDPARTTGAMLKTQEPPGITAVRYWRAASAGGALSPDDLDLGAISDAGVLHVTGITPALSPNARAAVEAAVDAAEAAGVPVSFDVNHRASLWHDADPGEIYAALAARASIVFAGREEAALIVGDAHDDELVGRLAALGPTTVALKLGAEGCLVRDGARTIRRAALPIQPVDTVGAGDAFVAGYLAELLRGAALETRVDTAVHAGAFACLGPGDWESLPDRRQLALFTAAADGDPVRR